jgi:translocation and assembly module TamB
MREAKPFKPRPAAPVRAGLGLLWPLAWVALAAGLVVLAGWLALRWLLFDEAGARWLLERAPMVQVRGWQGALLSGRWQAERLRVQWDGGKAWIVIDSLDAQDMRWSWRPEGTLWLALEIGRLQARRVELETGPPAPRPLPLPEHLAPPLRVAVQQADIAEFQFEQLQPIAALQARELLADGRPGQRHRIGAVSARGYGVQLAASATMLNVRPFDLGAQATVVPALAEADAPPWAAVLRAQGPLAAFDLAATLRGRPPDKQAAQGPTVDLQAQVQPLLAWPVQQLTARTEALDLSGLAAGAPQTRLGGELVLRAAARDAPVLARLSLQNALPGRWNERRAPFSRLEVEASGEIARPDRLELSRFEVQLAESTGAAGQAGVARGRASWHGHEIRSELGFSELRPQRLDTRAPAMTLSGPLELQFSGAPSPDPRATTKVPAWAAQAKLALEGRVERAPAPVVVRAEVRADAQGIELTHLQARTGGAEAVARVALRRQPGEQLRLETAGSLTNFDPMPWWPGEPGSAWRRGPHLLTAGWQFSVSLPTAAATLPPLALLQSLAGNGNLRLHESTLAGVPLAGEVVLGYSSLASVPGSLRMDLTLGGNRILVQGEGDPAGSGENDDWRVQLDAAQLATLAPLARLHPSLEPWVPRQGSVNVDFSAEGRWPRLSTKGRAQVAQLAAGRLALGQAQAQWQLDLAEAGTNNPVTVQASASDLRLGEQQVQQLALDVRGTPAEHRMELNARVPARPAPALETALGIKALDSTQLRVTATGQWNAQAPGGGRWRAGIERLEVAPGGGAQAPAAAAPPRWAEANNLRAELLFDREGRLLALQADPGEVQLAGEYKLRWEAVRVDLAGPRADFELRARVDAFALPPLLKRLQPGIAWEGDLRVGARLALRAAERFEADIAIQRQDGDLHIITGGDLQLLGLSEFRIGLTARDGLWDFEPAFNGRSLGEIRGRLRVRTEPGQRWPGEDAPIEGTLLARVPNIGIWATLVPPGWRIGGDVRTTFTIGGRFGAPTYTGELTAQGLAVRNLLQGVNISGGKLAVRLEGETATVQSFSVKGGDGELRATGSAHLGKHPSATLKFEADRFRVLGRVDRMVSASGAAELQLSADGGRLDGRFRIDEGLFDFAHRDAPSLDDDVSIRGIEEPAGEGADTTAQRPRRLFALGVDVDLGDKLTVKGRGLETGLAGEVRITNPGGRLAMRGVIRTVGGTYAAYGQKLELEKGVLHFEGPADNPRLDVLAVRPNLDIKVGVLVEGPLQSLRVRLYSEPPMSETDKLSWLVLGRPSDGLGRNDTALLQRAAVALLAGEGEAPTDEFMRRIGLTEFSLRQSEGDVRETVVSFGKQLSRRWYLGYERGVNSTTGTWQLIYRVAQRVTVRAQSGLENSLDLLWTWRFQEPPQEEGVRKSVPAAKR